ncbi:hypothetical protein BGZ52_009261 [Haplosporangium bisporale]|nr:hypothetical protein BGZ52_009261 [Haplosporangium bisporale]
MVILISQASLALLTFLALVPLASTHSTAWPTIAYSEELQPVQHDILPRSAEHQLTRNQALRRHLLKYHNQPLAKRQLDNWLESLPPTIVQKDDHVRLALTAYNTTYYLHLEPNFDLIHPDLRLSGGGESDAAQSNSHDQFKAFKGIVVQDRAISQKKWDRAKTTSRNNRATVEHMLYEEGVLGWARMMIEHDENDALILRGAFTVDNDTFHVTTRQHYHIQKRSDDHSPRPRDARSKSSLVIYRDSDLLKSSNQLKKRSAPPEPSCGAKVVHGPTEPYGYYYPPDPTSPLSSYSSGTGSDVFGMIRSGLLHKRDDSNDSGIMVTMAGPSPVPTGCPKTRMVTYIGVAADCAYVRSYDGLANARNQIFADFNTASGIYEATFNMALGIKSMVIESMNCPTTPVKGVAWNQDCSTNYTINNRLSDFSYWRGQNGRSNDSIGLWHLMTKCSSGAILGIAWTGALCQTAAIAQGTDYTAGTGVSSISPYEWMVVAHELGHGFGAQHDCTASTCGSGTCCPLSNSTCDAQDQFIMNPSEQAATRIFSPCSINAICSTIASSDGNCMQAPTVAVNKVQMANVNVCGNGIKEAGEQCDCGSPAECASDPCCDGTTCTYKGTAVCDDLSDDCCRNCQLAPANTICRSTLSTCDIAETCTGTSSQCPPDIIVPDLTACHGVGNVTGQCAKGVCTSRDLQCAQQQRAGITHQCLSSTAGCELLCNDPSGAANSCMKIPGSYFVDGTACGSKGTGSCANGKCILPGGWVPNHLSIFIPVVCVAILAIIGGAVGFICFRRRRKGLKTSRIGALSSASMGGAPSAGPPIGGATCAENKNKDVDVPRWMVANRRDSRSIYSTSRRDSQTMLSRRNSVQILKGEEEDGTMVANTPSGPTAQELQRVYFERFQHTQEQQERREGEEGFQMHMRPSDDGGRRNQGLDLGIAHESSPPVPPYSSQEYQRQDVRPFEGDSNYFQNRQDLSGAHLHVQEQQQQYPPQHMPH